MGRHLVDLLCNIWPLLPVLVATLVTTEASPSGGSSSGRKTHYHQDDLEGPVFLSEPPSSVHFLSTRGLSVPCTSYGRPAPVITWVTATSRNDDVLLRHGDVTTSVEEVPGLLRVLPNNTLRFLAFDDDRKYKAEVHAGHFRCVASNSVGTIVSRSMTVRADLVSKLQTYNVQVNDVYVTSGNTAVLTCDVNPYFMRRHVDVIAWKRGGHDIKPGGRFSIFRSGELHIRDVTSQDSYLMFTCVTKNNITSEVKVSDPATIYVSEPVNSAPTIEEPLRHLTVSTGTSIELPCVARGFPLPRYSWTLNDDVTLRTDNPRMLSSGGNLVLKLVTWTDTGTYKCVASNQLGSVTATVELTVTSPLSVEVKPSRQTVDVGHDAMFNCSVYGGPVTDVTWLRNGRLLDGEDHVTFPTRTTLLVRGVMRSDRGMYQCAVKGLSEVEALGSAQLDLGVSMPAFTARSDDVYVKPGSSASLSCVVTGNPTPTITWTVGGDPLPRDVRYRVVNGVTSAGDVTSYVNVTQIRVEDGGSYRCTATNEVGELSHVVKLNVYGVPYIRPLRNVTAVASHVMNMTCHVAGYPIKYVTWSKDGVELPSNHRQRVTSDGVLTVDDVTRGYDDGPYTCRAVNYEGQFATRTVHVTVTEPPVIDPFRFPRKKQGDRVSWTCAVSSGDLPMTFSWLKDGRQIPQDLGVITRGTGSYSSQLSIGSATPVHDGNYTCVVTNRASSVTMTSQLVVDVPPRWVVAPNDAFAVLGHDATLDCQADGKPKPEVVWRKAKGDVPGNYISVFNSTSIDDITNTTMTSPTLDMTSRMSQMANGSLYIRSARAEDHGYFLCHVGNGVGRELSKVVELLIHIPAMFDVAVRNVTSRLGTALTLDCEARGDRPLSLSWTFNGRQLEWQKDPRMKVGYYNTKDGRGSKLMIEKSARGDTGFYVCNAKNVFGSDVTMIGVTVQESPEAPIEVKVKQTGSRRVEISWQIPYDGNSAITGYDIIYKNTSDSWSSPTVRHQRADSTSANILDLHPAFTYTFRVRAENLIGQGSLSDVITVTMGEEVPSGPPTKVKVVALGSRSLNVTWQPPHISDQNGKVTGYFIGYKLHNHSAPYMYITHKTPSTSGPTSGLLWVTLGDLDKFTPYDVHIQAFNSRGAGPASHNIIARTLEDVPSQSPQGVQATALSATAILVTWSPPPLYTLHGVLQGYRVFYKPVRHDQDETDAEVLTTPQLSAALYHLSAYTNYSLQVLAYTRKGEGVRSDPMYVTTKQDVPGAPADIKAVPAASDAILVSWRAPDHSNGVVTKYVIYMRDMDSTGPRAVTTRLEVADDKRKYLVSALISNHKYSFRVSAATVVGEGETTRTIVATTQEKVPAQVASFPLTIHATWRAQVTLPCLPVGHPTPAVTWSLGGRPLVEDNRVQQLANGSVRIHHVTTRDAGNYTCHVTNVHGADEINVVLIVQAPPKAPVLTLAATTGSTIQVNWRSSSNGGSTIQGFTVTIWRRHGNNKNKDRKVISVSAQARTYTTSGLRCGSLYHVTVSAHNEIGRGKESNIITARTNGTAPIMPVQSQLVSDINATYVDLDLMSWGNGGCPLTSFDIRFRYWGDANWETVDNYVNPDTKSLRVPLRPATWYILRVTAHNEAGATDSTLKLATPTYMGATIEPIRIVHSNSLGFHEKPYVMIPLVGCLVVVAILVVAFILFCKRRQDKLSYIAEDNASNIRRDLTAETSLMSDLEKRLNSESHDAYSNDCPYTPSPGHQLYKVTQQSPGHKVTNISHSNSSEFDNENSLNKSNGLEKDDDTSLYATLRCGEKRLSQEDGYKLDNSGDHNQGVILSAQHYANIGNHRFPKHSNRVSIVSSNTTDSSNREELELAFARQQENPYLLPLTSPIKKSILRSERSPSESTDPGVVQFTQSPPIRGLVMAGTTVPHYTGKPHLPPAPDRYRPTPCPRRLPEPAIMLNRLDDKDEDSNDSGNGLVYTTDHSGAPPNKPQDTHTMVNPINPEQTGTLVKNDHHAWDPQKEKPCDTKQQNWSEKQNNSDMTPAVTLRRSNTTGKVKPWVPQRRSSLRKSPPPPPPPRSSSEPSRYSPKKVIASPEERSPLFRPHGNMSEPNPRPSDEEEADILLEKYYRMLQEDNLDSDPGPSDDVIVLDECPFNDYSVI